MGINAWNRSEDRDAVSMLVESPTDWLLEDGLEASSLR